MPPLKTTRRSLLLGLAAAVLAACSQKPRFLRYSGPEVTRVVVQKGARKMYLMHGSEVLKDYDVDLGFAPAGPKRFEGDGKTPEGRYRIDRRNPRSSFHLSLGISYPNAEDIARARAEGKPPGGDIFIHGQPNAKRFRQRGNWTLGCIAVKNREMEVIYAMVRNGTVIDLYP